jgi:hypothetical protein
MDAVRQQVSKVSDLGNQVIAIIQEYDEAFPYASKENDDEIASAFVAELRKLVELVTPSVG